MTQVVKESRPALNPNDSLCHPLLTIEAHSPSRYFLNPMKIFFLAALIFTSLAGAETPTSILTLPRRVEKLANGMRIYMVKYPSPGAVAYQLPVHVGSRNEIEKGKTGFAHFFEHLMFRGTKNISGKDFGLLYSKLGCENNAWTSNDMTNYHGQVASQYLPQILAAEADRFQNLFFDEKQLKDEAGAVLGEYNKDVAQPEFVLDEALVGTAFKVHPYAHTTMGYKEDILKYTERYQDVWPFFKRYYRPSNVSLVLVGDFDFDKTLALVQEKFGGWKDPQMDPVTIPQEPPQKEARVVKVTLKKPTQTRITVAYKVPAFSTKNIDSMTLALAAEMSFSATSEFQKTYRFNKKWLDAIYTGGADSLDPGLFQISVRLADAGEKHRAEILKAIEAEVQKLRTQTPKSARLDETKKRFRNAALTNWFGSPEALASRIAGYTNYEPDLEVLDRVFERMDQVTPLGIQAFAKKHLVDTGKTTATLEGSGKP